MFQIDCTTWNLKGAASPWSSVIEQSPCSWQRDVASLSRRKESQELQMLDIFGMASNSRLAS
ncbi:hypothetical protein BT69DRAFT_1289905 [Atractiella rhizophila]|nr:hypothetical protein BT69DRAFT_1289905 [Atractiella rhizophila]